MAATLIHIYQLWTLYSWMWRPKNYIFLFWKACREIFEVG